MNETTVSLIESYLTKARERIRTSGFDEDIRWLQREENHLNEALIEIELLWGHPADFICPHDMDARARELFEEIQGTPMTSQTLGRRAAKALRNMPHWHRKLRKGGSVPSRKDPPRPGASQ